MARFYKDKAGKTRPITDRKGTGLKRPRFPSEGIKHEGSLEKHGYNLEESDEKRREALDKAEKEYGYKETIDKLAALEGVNKGHPNHAKVKGDIEYLQGKHREG